MEVRHKGRITGNIEVSYTRAMAFGVHRRIPGVGFRTDRMTPEEIAAESSEVRTMKICPVCKGKKGFFSYQPDIHGDVASEWDDCPECDGEGVVPKND